MVTALAKWFLNLANLPIKKEAKPFISAPLEVRRETRRAGSAVWWWFEVDKETAFDVQRAYSKLSWTCVHHIGERFYLDVLSLEVSGKCDHLENLRTDLLAANLDPANYGL